DDGHHVDVIDAVGIFLGDIGAVRDASHEAGVDRLSCQVEVVGKVLHDTGIGPNYRWPHNPISTSPVHARLVVASRKRHIRIFSWAWASQETSRRCCPTTGLAPSAVRSYKTGPALSQRNKQSRLRPVVGRAALGGKRSPTASDQAEDRRRCHSRPPLRVRSPRAIATLRPPTKQRVWHGCISP